MSKTTPAAENRVTLTADLPAAELTGLIEDIRRAGEKAADFVFTVAAEGVKIPARGFNTSGAVSAESLGLLLAAALAATDIDVPTKDAQLRVLDGQVAQKMSHVAYAVNAGTGRSETSANDSLRHVACTIGTSFSLQSSALASFGRFALLSGHVEVDGMELGDPLPLRKLIERKFGVEASGVVAVLFSCWVTALRNPTFFMPDLLREMPNKEELTPIFTRILDEHSISIEDLREQFLTSMKDYPPFGRTFGIFCRRPFVKVGPDFYISSPHPYARLAFSNGLLFLTREAAAALATREGTENPYDNEISQLLGSRFEKYSFWVGRKAMPSMEAHEEYEYLRKDNALSPDGIYLLGNKECVLLQAKLRLPSRGLLLGDPATDFARDFSDSYAKLIAASVKYLINLEKAEKSGRLRAETSELSMKVLRAKRWTLLGVVPMMPPVAHFPSFKRLLRNGVKQLLRAEQYAWFTKMRAKGRICMVHVESIDALEMFVALGGKRNFASSLRTWHASTKRVSSELAKGSRVGMPAGFEQYCRIKGKNRRLTEPEWLRAAFATLMDEALVKHLVAGRDEDSEDGRTLG